MRECYDWAQAVLKQLWEKTYPIWEIVGQRTREERMPSSFLSQFVWVDYVQCWSSCHRGQRLQALFRVVKLSSAELEAQSLDWDLGLSP